MSAGKEVEVVGENLKWVVGGIVAVGAGAWWYNTQSSFVEMSDGTYSCRAVEVNDDDKDMILTSKGKPAYGFMAVEGGEMKRISAPQGLLGWSNQPDLAFENKGRYHVRVTDRRTFSSTRYAFSCDHQTDRLPEGVADTPSTSRPERDSVVRGKRIRWNQAINHVGENQTVCGRLANTGTSGDDVFLNLGRGYPDPKRFQIVLWDVGNIDTPRSGHRLCATGRITEYRGVAQIELRSVNGVEVLE